MTLESLNLNSLDPASPPLRTLRLSRNGRVLTVGVDAPPHNFMTTTMQQDLLRVVRAVDADTSIGVVVLTGAVTGRFITHFDIADLLAAAEAAPSLPRPAARALLAAVRALSACGAERIVERSRLAGVLAISRFHQLVLGIARSRALWIAAIDGPCGGGGLEMSVFCDMRIAAETATFIVPELSVGLTTTVGAQRFTHLVGPARALEMMLEARAYSAAEAQAAGLVQRVVPQQDLLEEAARTAARYARRPSSAVAAQKRIINQAYTLGARAVLKREGIAQLTGVPTPGTRAALRRWLAMRQPDGDSVFLTSPGPWRDGTAVDFHQPPP
ncbi:enoyl-CoA hydratase/carnithine racemase [Actinoplanes lutulentus]|uniref:Enoyl-CoA hydratase/carnithine racemase n=1 Tax=Actinoplanes lutulentus TaxID=1287878 RepID=A0A327ZQ16_9ACTN|nr:enoyl-CoA hydratase/isomerase family protein [Actinoplanes lutulentus]MBB2940565.1 enoyl-CoA hydratase/carnithine racemase [Actinoplanes lutulentus]RAK42878.1 enoyl-CoA hydratase/carnithine racemase [Actinoplanes lutulentus]